MKPIRGLWRLWTSTRTMGVVMVVLTAISGASLYVQESRNSAISACVAAYTAGFSRALDARTVSQADFNNSLNALIYTIYTSGAPAQVREAFTKYVTAAQKRDAALQANPYPDPRSAVCT